jgi:ribosomal-protein-alanine N-acetyltransferase
MITINFTPFQNLETERLLLRRVVNNDLKEVIALRSNPEIVKYIPRPQVKTKQDGLDHIAMINDKIEANEGINWAITLKDDVQLIGIIGHYRIKPEHHRSDIGYMILPEHNGKGIVTEAIKAVIKYGFETLKLHSIGAVIDPKNVASAKVLKKNGFVKEAHLIENEFFEGRYLDSVIYSLLNKK